MAPTTNEMKAATIGEPEALPSSALVGAWTAIRTPAMIARTSEIVAPFILFPPVEQVAVLARLRAQILRRRGHLAAKLRRCVPRPARVVEDAAGKRDHVGVAGADDRFRLLGLGDHADRDNRHVVGALDLAGEWNLVARTDWYLLARVEPT